MATYEESRVASETPDEIYEEISNNIGQLNNINDKIMELDTWENAIRNVSSNNSNYPDDVKVRAAEMLDMIDGLRMDITRNNNNNNNNQGGTKRTRKRKARKSKSKGKSRSKTRKSKSKRKSKARKYRK
jgi:hypothetical protein